MIKFTMSYLFPHRYYWTICGSHSGKKNSRESSCI